MLLSAQRVNEGGEAAKAVDRRRTQLSDDFVAVDLAQMQQASHYNDWIVSQIQPYCGRRILEVGAGIGNISTRLLQHAEYLCALEPNPACFDSLWRDLEGEPKFDCRPWRIEDCDREFITSQRIDTIVCVNVLEHVEHDVAALKQFKAMLPAAGGRLVLVVPAGPGAYGSIDAALGHYRRYSRPLLRSVLVEAGFSIRVVRYSNFIGLLGWLYNARFERRVQQSAAQIRFFDRLIVPWYSQLERLVPPPIGLSLVAVAHAGR